MKKLFVTVLALLIALPAQATLFTGISQTMAKPGILKTAASLNSFNKFAGNTTLPWYKRTAQILKEHPTASFLTGAGLLGLGLLAGYKWITKKPTIIHKGNTSKPLFPPYMIQNTSLSQGDLDDLEHNWIKNTNQHNSNNQNNNQEETLAKIKNTAAQKNALNHGSILESLKKINAAVLEKFDVSQKEVIKKHIDTYINTNKDFAELMKLLNTYTDAHLAPMQGWAEELKKEKNIQDYVNKIVYYIKKEINNTQDNVNTKNIRDAISRACLIISKRLEEIKAKVIQVFDKNKKTDVENKFELYKKEHFADLLNLIENYQNTQDDLNEMQDWAEYFKNNENEKFCVEQIIEYIQNILAKQETSSEEPFIPGESCVKIDNDDDAIIILKSNVNVDNEQENKQLNTDNDDLKKSYSKIADQLVQKILSHFPSNSFTHDQLDQLKNKIGIVTFDENSATEDIQENIDDINVCLNNNEKITSLVNTTAEYSGVKTTAMIQQEDDKAQQEKEENNKLIIKKYVQNVAQKITTYLFNEHKPQEIADKVLETLKKDPYFKENYEQKDETICKAAFNSLFDIIKKNVNDNPAIKVNDALIQKYVKDYRFEELLLQSQALHKKYSAYLNKNGNGIFLNTYGIIDALFGSEDDLKNRVGAPAQRLQKIRNLTDKDEKMLSAFFDAMKNNTATSLDALFTEYYGYVKKIYKNSVSKKYSANKAHEFIEFKKIIKQFVLIEKLANHAIKDSEKQHEYRQIATAFKLIKKQLKGSGYTIIDIFKDDKALRQLIRDNIDSELKDILKKYANKKHYTDLYAQRIDQDSTEKDLILKALRKHGLYTQESPEIKTLLEKAQKDIKDTYLKKHNDLEIELGNNLAYKNLKSDIHKKYIEPLATRYWFFGCTLKELEQSITDIARGLVDTINQYIETFKNPQQNKN